MPCHPWVPLPGQAACQGLHQGAGDPEEPLPTPVLITCPSEPDLWLEGVGQVVQGHCGYLTFLCHLGMCGCGTEG